MNVCMLAYTFYEADNRVMRYAETLAARGDHVDVISLRRSNLEQDSCVNGVNVVRVQTRVHDETAKLTYLFRLLAFLVRSTLEMWKRNRHTRYDLVHVHSVPDFLVFAALPLKMTGAKVILDIHDILPELYCGKFGSARHSLMFRALVLTERICAAVSDHVIIANDLWRDRLIRRSTKPTKCTTIMNYPDGNIFFRRGRSRNDGRFVILYPGSLNWHQGLDLAIRALAKIRDRVPQADLHIYGNGPEKHNLTSLALELGLRDRVFVHDSMSIREIARVMENADLAVVPKRGDSFGNEAFSTKTLEFMTLGVPLVVAATEIDRYYFRNNEVLFFGPGDVEDLAASLLAMIEDPQLRQAYIERGSRLAALNEWEQKKHLYLDLVEGLTGNVAPRPADILSS